MNVYHVYPIKDTKQHYLECVPETLNTERPYCNCNCHPEHKEIGNAIQGITSVIVVHNSFDGREGVEWANEILGK